MNMRLQMRETHSSREEGREEGGLECELSDQSAVNCDMDERCEAGLVNDCNNAEECEEGAKQGRETQIVIPIKRRGFYTTLFLSLSPGSAA